MALAEGIIHLVEAVSWLLTIDATPYDYQRDTWVGTLAGSYTIDVFVRVRVCKNYVSTTPPPPRTPKKLSSDLKRFLWLYSPHLDDFFNGHRLLFFVYIFFLISAWLSQERKEASVVILFSGLLCHILVSPSNWKCKCKTLPWQLQPVKIS